MRKFDNQGLALIETRTKHTDTPRYDVVISGRFETIKAYSLTERELNTVTKALDILDQRRFGTVKDKG